jgi:photosystem II stability/assembly factor-like uncharacterized protein
LSRARIFGIALAWLIAITVVMVGQRPFRDPLLPPARWTSLEWWRQPIERNPLLRLQSVGGIHDVVGRPASTDLFAVGEGGIVLRSRDGGVTWERRPVNWEPSSLPAATPSSMGTPPPANTPPPDAPTPRQQPPALEDVQGVVYMQEAKAPDRKAPEPDPKGPVDDDKSQPPRQQRADPRQQTAPQRGIELGLAAAPPRLVPNSDLNAVAFSDGERGWAVGDNGTVLETKDGGETWRLTAPRIGDRLVAAAGIGQTFCAFSEAGITTCADDASRWEAPLRTVNAMRLVSVSADASGMWVFLKPDGAAVRSAGTDTLILAGNGRSWRVVDDDTAFGDVRAARDGKSVWYIDPDADGGTQDVGQLIPPAQDPIERTGQVPVRIDRVLPLDAARAWGVGADGSVLFTDSGGERWRSAAAPISSQPRHVWPIDSEQVVVGDEDGGLYRVSLADGWHRVVAPQITRARMLADGRQGWAIGDRGTILSTADGGESWEVVPSGLTQNLSDLTFSTDGRKGWVVGDDVVLRTADGGSTWSRWDRPPDEDRLLAIQMLQDGLRGFVLSATGVLGTQDGGATWQAVRISGEEDIPADVRAITDFLPALQYRSSTAGRHDPIAPVADGWWLYSRSGATRFQFDGRLVFTRLDREAPVIALASDGDGALWTVGSRGFVRAGASPISLSTIDDLTSIAFSVDGSRVWIGGRGVVFSNNVRDALAAPWKQSSVAMSSSWHQIVPFAANRALALGAGATMYRTEDGETWAPITYRQYPAPWYYLAFLIGLAPIAYLAVKKPAPEVSPAPSVADVFVSDRPLERGDADALSHAHLAAGLARFLANEKTEPPLTIAITGEWGTGKTSMMNIAREMLTSFGFRTVWFNAWHHQTEEHLLGALLESLRRHALPPWWSPRGLRVRVRLLGLRGMRQWGPAALVIAASGAAAGYFLQEPLETLAEARQWVVALFTGATPIPADIVDVLAVLGTAGGLVPLLKSMQTWGMSAPKLKNALSAYDPLSELKLPTGFRHRFADIFSDITRALQPQQLVIFVDDLDRCQPESVVATLEMINFLVSSGRCIVVLGMARERVERCVGLGFKDLAELAADDSTHRPSSADAAAKHGAAVERRDEFARQYLEKLVNIELPIPKSGPTESSRLVTSALYDKARVSKARQRTWDTAVGWAGVALAAAIAALGYWAGTSMHAGTGPAEPTVVAAVATPTATASTAVQPSDSTPRPAEAATSDDLAARALVREPNEAVFLEAASDEPPWVQSALVIVLAFLIGIVSLSAPRVHVEHDSSEFVESLNRWFGGVHAKSPTPRAIKRFLNRLRFYAMEQRKTTTPQNAWERLMRRPVREIASPVENIPERTLVALGVLQHALGDRDLLAADIRAAREASATDTASPDAMQKARDLEGAEDYLDSFLYLARGSSIRR